MVGGRWEVGAGTVNGQIWGGGEDITASTYNTSA